MRKGRSLLKLQALLSVIGGSRRSRVVKVGGVEEGSGVKRGKKRHWLIGLWRVQLSIDLSIFSVINVDKR
jgi:hypothetical protein